MKKKNILQRLADLEKTNDEKDKTIKQAGAELSQAQASLSKLELFSIRHPSNTLCWFQFLYDLQYIVRSSLIFWMLCF